MEATDLRGGGIELTSLDNPYLRQQADAGATWLRVWNNLVYMGVSTQYLDRYIPLAYDPDEYRPTYSDDWLAMSGGYRNLTATSRYISLFYDQSTQTVWFNSTGKREQLELKDNNTEGTTYKFTLEQLGAKYNNDAPFTSVIYLHAHEYIQSSYYGHYSRTISGFIVDGYNANVNFTQGALTNATYYKVIPLVKKAKPVTSYGDPMVPPNNHDC